MRCSGFLLHGASILIFAVTCVDFFLRKRNNKNENKVCFNIFNQEKAFQYKQSFLTADLNVQRDQWTAHNLSPAKGSNEHLADLPFNGYFIEVSLS